MSASLTILKKVWGHDRFRPLQQEIVHAALEGKDVLALLPTGGGKSICFQVPALVKDGVCIVITPLIALMKDQVEQLNNRGIKAAAIYSGMSKREIDITLDNCAYGPMKFLYVSPERIKTEIFRERVLKMNVNFIVVDEAHCISQWGYDFRPSYLEIVELRKLLPEQNVIALTATATKKVKEDIKQQLAFQESETFQASFARSNLSYSVRNIEDKNSKLLEVLNNVKGCAIVYVRTRKGTKEIAQFLTKHEVQSSYYNAGLSMIERNTRQENWVKNRTRVMVATNAFGMGIDKPDVRVVVHMDLPDTLEAYYQEAGRAGRDTRKAFAVVLYNNKDCTDLMDRVEKQYPSVELMKKVYQSLANYYKLAVGSSEGESYDFDIADFCEVYGYNSLVAYNVIKKLENEGVLQLNEAFYNPSKLIINLDSQGIYEFLIANAQYDHFIKSILRIYGGELFSNFITISEQRIAKFLEITVQQVKSTLVRLNQLEVIGYQPQKEVPQLVFVQARQDASKLQIDVAGIKSRKELAIKKAKNVVNYVTNKFQCRTQQLLYYFGELNDNSCDVCDNCLDRKKQYYIDTDFQEIRTKIIEVIGGDNLELDELVKGIKGFKKENIIDSIRKMVDVGELQYDELKRVKLV